MSEPLWFDVIYNLVWQLPSGELDMSDYGLPIYRIEHDRDRSAMADAICAKLKSIDSNSRTEKIQLILSEHGRTLTVSDRYRGTDWEQVRNSKPLMDVGAHTVHHHILSQLAPEDCRAEIARSRHTIEEKIGSEVKFFAYPNGRKTDFTEVTKEIVKQEGFQSAVTSISGVNYPGDDLWELKRIGIGSDMDMLTFKLAVTGTLDLLRSVKRLLGWNHNGDHDGY
jgi:peptidoglycan/xylan/chitin deacetylase (PgdA/CDA1 family)